MADDPRSISDSTYDTGEERIAYLLDGVRPPAPQVAVAQTPLPVKASGFAGEPAAEIGTNNEEPGFFSKLWAGVKEAAPVVGTAIGKGLAAKAGSSSPVASPGFVAPEPPKLPPWALWAAVAGALVLVLYLLKRD